MDNTGIEETGIHILESAINKNCPCIRTKINKMDKYPIWDGEFLLYKSNKYSNSEYNGQVFVQVKSTSKIKKVKTYRIEKDLLHKYTFRFGVLLLRPYSNWDQEPPLIYYKFLYPKDVINLIKQSNAASCEIALEQLTDHKKFSKECFFFSSESPKQANIENILNFSDLVKKVRSTFTLAAPAGLSLDEAIISGKHNLYYKSEGKYDVILDGKITEIAPELNLRVAVEDKEYFNKVIKRVSHDNGITYIFNKALFMKVVNDLSAGVVLYNYTFCMEQNVPVIDFLTAMRFLLHLAAVGCLKINGTEIKVKNTKIPKSNKDIYLEFEDVATLMNMLRININELYFKDIYENNDLINELVSLIVYKNDVNSQSDNDASHKIFLLFGRTIFLLFIRIDGEVFRPIYINDPSVNDPCQVITPEGEHAVVSKFLLLSMVKAVKSIDGFFDEVYDDLIKQFDSKVSSQYILFVLDCIHIYDEDNNDAFLSFALSLVDKLLEIDNVTDNEIYTINKYQIVKRKRKLKENEKDIINKIVHDTSRLDIKACCNILLDKREEVELHLKSLKKEDEDSYNNFMSYPIYTLYKSNID